MFNSYQTCAIWSPKNELSLRIILLPSNKNKNIYFYLHILENLIRFCETNVS